jgi:hypothetical protein
MRFSNFAPFFAALAFCGAAAESRAATPVSGRFYWTTFGSTNTYGYGSFNWNGTTLTASTTPLGTLPSLSVDGSLKVGADGNIYSGRAGSLTQINPVTGVRRTFSSGVNNNVTSIDPAGTTVWVGWKDTPLASFATGSAFGPGTPRALNGSDTVATALAWLPDGTVWYTTGGENVLGNVGRINLTTFTTTRVLTNVSATSMVYDPFTGHLFTAGINGIAQINPATNAVVSTWANPLGTGQRIQNLDVTGQGHLVALDSSGLLRLWDFSSGSKLIGQQDTLKVSAGVQVTDAGMELANVPDLPAITSPLQVTTRIGKPFVYTIETNVPVNSTSASNLPPGLLSTVVPRTITGTPTQAGTFQVPISATNNFGTANATLVINVQPASSFAIVSSSSATGRTGQPFRFQVITSGGSAATRLSVDALPAGLRVDSMSGVISGTPSRDGSHAVTLTATNGNATATGTLQLTFNSDPRVPVIVSGSEASIAPGEAFNYTIAAPAATSASDATQFELIGNLPPGLGFDPNAGKIFGTYTPGSTSVAATGGKPLSGGVVTNVQLFATNSLGTSTLPLVFFLKPAGVVNISTRLAVQTGENVLIGGFIVTGNAPKKLLLRAIGPSLPLAGRLTDPVMELYDANGILGSNDNWRSHQEQEIIDTTIPPTDDRESAVLATLNPGAYTAIVAGKAEGQGVGLVEVYDLGTASLDSSSAARLANISTRGFVQRDADVMIGGFIISGANTNVIVRAIGPSLGASGVNGALENTTLELRDSNGDLLAENDDWRSNQQQEIINTGVPPGDDRESAVVRALPPGSYTAIVSGKAETTGVALVEAYVLN